jgi:hypothetical protein
VVFTGTASEAWGRGNPSDLTEIPSNLARNPPITAKTANPALWRNQKMLISIFKTSTIS